MKSKNIKGINKVDELKLKLVSVSENLYKNIDDNSRKTQKLLQEYKKIKKQIEIEEQKVENEKRREQEKLERMARKEERERNDIEIEYQEMIDEIVTDKEFAIEQFEKKQEKINKKISKLEYQKEELIQNLRYIKEEKRAKALEELESAKQNEDIQAMIDSKQKIEDIRKEEEKLDKSLKKVKARLTINIFIKIVKSESEIKKVREEITKYNEDALEYNLEPFDLKEYLKKNDSINQIRKIKKDEQHKYYTDTIGKMLRATLDEEKVDDINVKNISDKEREAIELESNQRLKNNSLPMRAIKAIGIGAARGAGKIVGATILAGKFIGEHAKKIWQNIRKDTNKTLASANKVMLNGTTKLRKKLEEDAKTFEARREKLTSAIKSPVNEEKAIESSAKKDESKTTEKTLEQDE